LDSQLAGCFEDGGDTTGKNNPSHQSKFEGNQVRYLLQQFCKAICATHPVVLFLDNLQWLDAALLDLLKDLVVDPPKPSFFLLGACQSNEVSADTELSKRLLLNDSISNR
jgi:predicted ATPase